MQWTVTSQTPVLRWALSSVPLTSLKRAKFLTFCCNYATPVGCMSAVKFSLTKAEAERRSCVDVNPEPKCVWSLTSSGESRATHPDPNRFRYHVVGVSDCETQDLIFLFPENHKHGIAYLFTFKAKYQLGAHSHRLPLSHQSDHYCKILIWNVPHTHMRLKIT